MEEQRKYKFKDGDAVAHVDNLSQKMHVSRIVKKIKKEPTGKMAEGKPVYVSIDIMLGVECHWWEDLSGKRTFRKEKFHSHELLPWDIAQKNLREYEQTKVH